MHIMALHHPHRLLLDTSSSSGDVNRTKDSSLGDPNFDTNMVIILAALLCALICALGLNSIVRCALRCSRRLAFETPDEAAARLAVKGLKKSALHQIPIVVYGNSGATNSCIKATDCAICLGEFMNGEKIRVLPKCNHGFHVKCIDTWLQSHSSCPTCRRCLIEQPATSSEVATVAVAVAAASGTRNSHEDNNASGGYQPDHVAVVVDEIS
ncbi:RING-H2 finger protein ATL74-like [Arachis stenosperma]|uniref:RING-H2 finger protein ATL74-like n=1 Tax=Arachis stenosperma TaxID=217475 RepID=UPI0025ACC498|nr:RING-H2 finger protein ATL74-like [Arachis stenosperma]